MIAIHSIRSFAALRGRAESIDLGGSSILVASLPDIIRSTKAVRRPRDLAVLEVLEKALEEKRGRTAKLAAVRRESERGPRR